MVEVEVKLKINSVEEIEKSLVGLGFEKIHVLQEMDCYYNGVDRDFRKSGEALRLRLSESLDGSNISSAQITYKGPKLDNVSMSRTEYEVRIDDFETMQSILSSLGYNPVMPVCKIRREYKLNEINACVDTVDGLGDFLELEIMVQGEKMRQNALDKISTVLGKLGFGIEDTTTTSYLSMLEEIN